MFKRDEKNMENNNLLTKKDNIIKRLIYSFIHIFDTKKKTFLLLSIFLFIVVLFLTIYPAFFNTFLNCNTDDVIQYHSYAIGFYNRVKNGTLSIYDEGLWAGSSFFASVYYLPLDLFFIFGLLLSYIMPTEYAYVFTNLLRVFGGSIVFYIFLSRKNISPLTSFLSSIIFFVGGVTETEFVFPVYLGVCFYAPLALLLADLVIEKKRYYYLLIPLYTFVVIIYDYYIAYMLIALLCIYFVIAYHMYLKKFFLLTKEFYLRLLELLVMIGIGLLIGAFMMLPSLAYVLNESTRTDTNFDASFIYFSEGSGESLKIAIRHYFTGWMSLFTPNNPFYLALVGPGDYVREHYSFYLTSGGLIYLVYFFFISKKENHRLKFWVLLFNVMFLMPIFSMIFTVSKQAYTRWFFIPYMINIYAMARGMNHMNLKVGKYNIAKVIPFIILACGLASTMLALITDPDYYIHYSKGKDDYFYPILIGSAIFISLYLLILFFGFIFQMVGKKRVLNILYKFIPVIIFGEVIFALVVDFSNIGSTNYVYNYDKMEEDYNHLKSLGYNNKDGYRINLFTDTARYTTNANVMFTMTNSTSFFQSFYNQNLNVYSRDIHNDYSDFWGRGSIYGYSLINGPMWNLKYIAEKKEFEGTYFPEKYYELLDQKNETSYYSVKDAFNFIVYDEVYTDPGSDSFFNDLSLLQAGFVKLPEASRIETSKVGKDQYAMYEKIKASNIKFVNFSDVKKEIGNTYDIKVKSTSTIINNDEEDGFFKYDISEGYEDIFNMDICAVIPNASDIQICEYERMYIKRSLDDTDKYYPLHYNTFYNGYSDYGDTKELWVQYKEKTNSKYIKIYGYNYDIYDDFVTRQKEYKNRSFEIDDSKINIKFTNTTNSTKIVKTGYTYSDDWFVNEGYETCSINGGFLGIIVKGDIKNVDINLSFKPKYFDTGCKLTALGCIIYFSLCISYLGVVMLKNKGII